MHNKIDDGFNPELVSGAVFDGVFEIPRIARPKEIIIPTMLIPFSERTRSESKTETIQFYEYDTKFAQILSDVNEYLPELQKFAGVISPDFSLYRDMPFTLQITNTYFNRAVGYYLQSHGSYVIPNIRWSDERSYTRMFGEHEVPLAFSGVEKHSIVSVGSYGCIKNRENRFYFEEGLNAMLNELEPEVVLVYGSMPEKVFGPYMNRTRFVHYPDWTSLQRRSA